MACYKGEIGVLVEKKVYIVHEGEQPILVKKLAKKSSGSDTELSSSFSVEVSSNIGSSEELENQTPIDTMEGNRDNTEARNEVGSDILSEITQQGYIPLEDPIVDFPDR